MKDPTSFQALIQVCQGYDRQVKDDEFYGGPPSDGFGCKLDASRQSSDLIFNCAWWTSVSHVYTTTIVNSTCVFHEVEQGKSEQGTMALVNRRFDEVMAHLRQSQAIHLTLFPMVVALEGIKA